MDFNKFDEFLKNPNCTIIETSLLVMLLINLIIIIISYFIRRHTPLGFKSVLPDFALIIFVGFIGLFLKYFAVEVKLVGDLCNNTENFKTTSDYILLLENRYLVNQILKVILLFGPLTFFIWWGILIKTINFDKNFSVKKMIESQKYVPKILESRSSEWDSINYLKSIGEYLSLKKYEPFSIEYKLILDEERKNSFYSKQNILKKHLEDSPYYFSGSILVIEFIIIFILTFTNRF